MTSGLKFSSAHSDLRYSNRFSLIKKLVYSCLVLETYSFYTLRNFLLLTFCLFLQWEGRVVSNDVSLNGGRNCYVACLLFEPRRSFIHSRLHSQQIIIVHLLILGDCDGAEQNSRKPGPHGG